MDFISSNYLNFELTELGQCLICMDDDKLLYPQHCITCFRSFYKFCECCDCYIRIDCTSEHQKKDTFIKTSYTERD